MFKRRIALGLIIFLITLSAGFAKPRKKAVTVPTKVQEKIKNTEESPKSWYICELKGKTKAGNVVIGPVEQRELILLVWIANSIQPNKDYCIAKNKTYISKNPEVFFKDEFANIKNDINKFGVADTYEKYFFTNYLTRSIKLNVDGSLLADSESKNEADDQTKEEELTLQEGSPLTRQMIEEQNRGETQVQETAQQEAEPEPEEAPKAEAEPVPKPEPTPELEPILEPELIPEPEPEPVPEPVEVTKPVITKPVEPEIKKEILVKEEPAPQAEAVPETKQETLVQSESKEEQSEYDNLLFSKLNQDKDNIQTIVETDKRTTTPIAPPVTSLVVEETKTKPLPEPKPEPAPEPEPIPEPVPEPISEPAVETVAENSFELPISTSPSTNVSRYQRENLLDYAPKKTPPLPSDEDFTSYQLIASPDQADSKGVTLLMKAAKAGNNWELKNLLNSGANVNLKDSDGWTALMYAVRYQENTSIIDLLISAGAQVKTKNSYNVSALMLASTYNGNPEILRKLLSYYSPSEKEVVQSFVLMLSDNYSSDYSKAAKVDTFIEKSISLNSFYNGKTPLMYAAQYCSSTIVIKKLLDYGAGTSIRSADGKTAFDFAKENPTLPHDDVYWMLNRK